MPIYDIIMLLVLAAAVAFGLWKGLTWQLASLAAIFLSGVVAVQFRDPVANLFDADPTWSRLLAMLVLYLGTSLVIWIVYGLVRNFINKFRLKEFDRHAGALIGAAKGVILCIIITLFAVTLLQDQHKKQVATSYSGYYIAKLIDRAHGALPDDINKTLHPFMEKLDKELEHDHTGPALTGDHHDDESGHPVGSHTDVEHTAEHLLDAAKDHLKTNR